MPDIAKTSFDDKRKRWIPIGDRLPPERKIVLVWLEGLHLPFIGYLRYAAGDKDSPFFVTPLFDSEQTDGKRPEVTHWCDCIPMQAYTGRVVKRWSPIAPEGAESSVAV